MEPRILLEFLREQHKTGEEKKLGERSSSLGEKIAEIDIENLLKALELRLTVIRNSLDEKVSRSRSPSLGGDLVSDVVRIVTDVTVRSGLLGFTAGEVPTMYSEPPDHEPLIDVFDEEKELRILVQLPGIRKEDVSAEVKEGRVLIRIKRRDATYYREIPCATNPSEIRVNSITENNSVLEILFSKSA